MHEISKLNLYPVIIIIIISHISWVELCDKYYVDTRRELDFNFTTQTLLGKHLGFMWVGQKHDLTCGTPRSIVIVWERVIS